MHLNCFAARFVSESVLNCFAVHLHFLFVFVLPVLANSKDDFWGPGS